MGEREFAISTTVLRATGYQGAIRIFIGVACISLGLLSAVEQFHSVQPLGPHGWGPRAVHLVLLVSAIGIGIGWLVRPWPEYRVAIGFVVWGDVALAASAAVLAVPQARLAGTVYMCLLGVFAAVLLGYRVLFVHCAYATATIAVFTWAGVHYNGVSLSELSLYFLPALTTVVVMPAVAAVAIEGTRRGLSATADAANRDPLTGLLNRRGLYGETQMTLTRCPPGAVLAVVLIDLDGFKQLNDNHGHGTGDATLRAVARQLATTVRAGDIAARVGGDEFVLIAGLSTATELDRFIDRVRGLKLRDAHGSRLRSSVGVTWERVETADLDLEPILHRADEAMYRAKRVGGGGAVVVEPPYVGGG
ncbi:GGDEF domain-containing protein [Mycolicibacterium sp. CH28]|uniref:GGDEF domain-containing protein n=1 Tax=Mycolicibacterium sp. CH28 TaxID=2512237 RepID=UPI00108013F2|nr:GGDEF domain-containing protein [Mycolicibacterium sp. CH28]TGD85147.1 GGDEF domain-containing protein [Mycolicibacterium sp. CH28]